MPVDNCQHGEDDLQTLGRAVRWRSVWVWPWRGLAASALLHTLFLLLFISAGYSLYVPAEDADTSARATVIPLFAPRKGDFLPSAHRTTTPVLSPLSETRALPTPLPDVADVNVDLNSIRLSFAPDLRNELPQVVQDQHGMLALLDKEDRTVAHYLVRPPGWEMEERIQDVSRTLRILMDPPEKWAVFRNVARHYGIDLSRYQACALFDLGFRHCLKNAILAKASAASAHSGRVRSARLAIVADRPCGIAVLEVSFEAK